MPAALVVISEHIGHLFVTSNIVGRDLLKVPGLHNSLLGDGLSTMLSGLTGSCPTTTYGENMGVMAITRVYSVWVIGGAAVISIVIAFFGQVSGAIRTHPGAGDRRHQHHAVRRHRRLRPAHADRGQGRLLQEPQPAALGDRLRGRHLRACRSTSATPSSRAWSSRRWWHGASAWSSGPSTRPASPTKPPTPPSSRPIETAIGKARRRLPRWRAFCSVNVAGYDASTRSSQRAK